MPMVYSSAARTMPGAAGGTQTSSIGQATNTATIKGMAFDKSTITIKAGQTITWLIQDTIAHDLIDDQGAWDSGSLAPGASYQQTFAKAGQYSYHCSIHPFMVGKIVVTP